MKKSIITCLTLLLTTLAAAQTDYSKYYQNLPKPMPVVQAPVIPENRVNLRDFGGVGDGTSLNTQAFAKAISALNKQGGGHLIVPAGVWLTGLISLKDNIDLHLERNALIIFSPDKRDLIPVEDGKADDKAKPGLTASKRKNISITGEGIIDGNGEYWRPVKRGKVSDTEWNQYKAMGGTVTPKGDLWYPFDLKHFSNVAVTYEAQEKMRTHLVRFTDCENVLIQGVTLRNSPKFHFVPQRCNNVIVDGIKVDCPWNAQNGDAIDIGNCKNVLVVNNTINAGDDGICMKGGVGDKGAADGPCENINIQDNTVYHAHGGFVIGSEFCGGMNNIYVHNNTFAGTDTGLRFKSAAGRGGTTKDIYISNIFMTDIKDEAIVFQCDYFDNHVGAEMKENKETKYLPNFTDIHISDVVCYGAKTGIKALGQKGMVHGIDIKNCTIFYTDKDKDIAPDCELTLDNVKLTTFTE
ncbi:MAG: glycoside hydrolase family 28 protein [Prevotella sp.]|nr:glycoside hydrolase family 28 protein [Prevotella sp.]